jgi:hypothetical protein
MLYTPHPITHTTTRKKQQKQERYVKMTMQQKVKIHTEFLEGYLHCLPSLTQNPKLQQSSYSGNWQEREIKG